MIVLFTDYGLQGPYLGEVEAVLFRYAPSQKVLTLMADVPRQNVQAGAYLLSALSGDFPKNTIFFCVVDPAVGSGRDTPVVIRMGEHRFVGPHNGLFDIVTRGEVNVECWEITYQPKKLSATFHGRDLYAPVCAMLSKQQPVPGKPVEWRERNNWPRDLKEVIYFDGFGNAWTGIQAVEVNREKVLKVNGSELQHAETFAEVSPGNAFWYENSNGLIEIAVNKGSVREVLNLEIGTEISF